MRYLICFSYDGSNFYGFQRLNDKPTIQKSLEEALSIIDKNVVIVKGAGRTDRGVHANGQCAHFDLVNNIPVEGLINVLNKLLKPYIKVYECRKVDSKFHARHSVKKKKYIYRIYLGEYNPFLYDYFYECSYSLDLFKMKEASRLFLGVHSFHNFTSGKRDSYEAIIYDIEFQKKDDILEISFIGRSFYRYMVRNMVGALLDIGRSKRSIEELEESLTDKKLLHSFSTVVSNGLYLDQIWYEEED